jgi:hypothetical protein
MSTWSLKVTVTIAAALLSVWAYCAPDAQFDGFLAPATRDAICVILFVLWVAAIVALGMIGENLDAAIHHEEWHDQS